MTAEQPQTTPQQPQQAAGTSCGLGSLLSAGCRGRAEAFARSLHRRLQTLGVGLSATGDPDEAPSPPCWQQQPLARVPSDADVFYDPLEASPPADAPPPPALSATVVTTAPQLHNCSSDSDSSEVLFFDPESSASTCSSAAEEEPFLAYNGRADSSSSCSETGTLSGISSSSSSSAVVNVCGPPSDDSRSTRTPSEENRSSPSLSQTTPTPSDDSGKSTTSAFSAIEPTSTAVYSVAEDASSLAELSVVDDQEEPLEEPLEEVLRRLRLSNGDVDGGCVLLKRARVPENGDVPQEVSHPEEAARPENGETLCNGNASEEALVGVPEQESSRSTITVDLRMQCEVELEERPVNGIEDVDHVDSSSLENLQSLIDEQSKEETVVAEDKTEENNGHFAPEEIAVPECRVVVSEVTEGNDDDDEEDDRPQRVRRCSSLKTGKTPPGTPGRKKIVRFADVLGLDLADVRTFLDEIPRIPSSAYDDLRDVDLEAERAPPPVSTLPIITPSLPPVTCCSRTLVPLFQQPWAQPDFMDRVRDRQVCLESATVQDPSLLSVSGVVRVRNLDFHKSVYVRYTLDGWRTWADLSARYVDGSCDGFSDRFSFVVYAHALPPGGRLEIAVRFQCRGAQFWDNNGGANYCFQSVSQSSTPAIEPLSPVDDRWPSFY